MTTQNYAAIVTMLAIVVTYYAIRSGESQYLIDLLALALALAAPRQHYAIGAVALLAIVRHSGLSRGLADGLPDWLISIILPGASHMSILDHESSALEAAYKARILDEKDDLKIEEIPRPVAENEAENVYFAESEALARLILAGKIGLTDAVQIGAGAKSGTKYQKHTALVKAAIERLENRYPPNSSLKRFD